MLLYVLKQEETVERIVKCFFTREKKPAPSSFLLCKNYLLLAASCLFPVARSCLTAL